MADKTPQEIFEENALRANRSGGMTPEQIEFAKQAGRARIDRMQDAIRPEPRRPQPGPVPKEG